MMNLGLEFVMKVGETLATTQMDHFGYQLIVVEHIDKNMDNQEWNKENKWNKKIIKIN